MPRFRAAKNTQHFCRIFATGFPVTTHCEASVYISVGIIVSGQKIGGYMFLALQRYTNFLI